MPKIHNWMSALKDDRKLVELCLPGSHDAGVYTDQDIGLEPNDLARCQSKKIGMQARYGSRVFDIRCFMKDTTPTMGHFFMDTAPLGSWGGTLKSALDDAIDFLATNTKEFLIFRIGHTKCTTEVNEVLKTTDPTSGKLKYANFILNGPRGNLANLQVKDLRGKLLLIFGEEFHEDFHVRDGYYPYVKYPDIPENGLSFCGTYVSDGPVWKDTNKTAKGAKNIALNASKEHKNHQADHLFWVYWQQTGGNVFKNTTEETGCIHGRLANFLSKFKNPKNELGDPPVRLPNVIGHDFVKFDTCSKIVKMNSDLAATLEPEF